jgi:hypothetical protein
MARGKPCIGAINSSLRVRDGHKTNFDQSLGLGADEPQQACKRGARPSAEQRVHGWRCVVDASRGEEDRANIVPEVELDVYQTLEEAEGGLDGLVSSLDNALYRPRTR